MIRSHGFPSIVTGVLLVAAIADTLISPVAATAEAAAPSQPEARIADPVAAGPLRTDGGNIVDAAGRVVHITGINWFGMETNTFAPHGLWARGLNDMLDQMVQAGFNTIRLPYSNQLFDSSSTPNGIDFQKNADLKGLTGVQIMDQIIQRAGERGLKVILDRHRPNANAQSELWYTDQISEQRWIDDWVKLAGRYRGNLAVIGADLHNEPHGPATWGDGNVKTDWRLAAQRAGNAVLQANPDWLIIVEGIEHQGDDWYWWGGNLALAGKYPVELSVPHKLVYSAHDYGPGVSGQKWFQSSDFPKNLPSIWDAHWGYLKRTGVAPVLMGEFGGRSVGSDVEGVWQRALVSYLQANGFEYTYWCWNPNSGDTGGILADDWTAFNQAKLSVLQAYRWPLLGSPTAPGQAIATVGPPQALPSATPSPTATPTRPSATPSPTATPTRPAATPSPTATPTRPAATPSSTATPTRPAATPSSTGSHAAGGPFDPDPLHALLGIGGPNDQDPKRRQARQADEQRYLELNGKPWDRAVYVTAVPAR